MYPKTFFANSSIQQRNGRCFVIMPFAEEFDETFQSIRRAVEGPELNFICARADRLLGAGQIIEGVLREIAQCEVLIADLSGRNPNVFYELGVAQMVKDVEKIILLNQGDEPLPFNVGQFRCINYDRSSQNQLKRDIVASIKAVAAPTFRFKMHSDEPYEFPFKVMGPDDCAYDFVIRNSFYAVDGAKFMLRINRYVAGERPTVVFDEPSGMGVGGRLQLPGLDWDIQLESVDGDLGRFVVLRRPTAAIA